MDIQWASVTATEKAIKKNSKRHFVKQMMTELEKIGYTSVFIKSEPNNREIEVFGGVPFKYYCKVEKDNYAGLIYLLTAAGVPKNTKEPHPNTCTCYDCVKHRWEQKSP